MARVNIKGLQAEIAAKGYKIFKPAAERRVRNVLESEAKKLMVDFESHPVTEEIDEGPNASNKSNSLGGYGNLFSFMGFESGSDPISPIRSLLAKSIQIKSFRKKRNRLGFKLRFTVPTKEQIDAISPMPWSTDSWTDAVEKGISGLGQYLHSKDRHFNTSRSGKGIQIDFDFSGGWRANSTPTDYVTGILNRMLKSIETNLRRL